MLGALCFIIMSSLPVSRSNKKMEKRLRFGLQVVRLIFIQAALSNSIAADSFPGSKAGAEREVGGVELCWCPTGKFTMGSLPGEPERRPGEDQVTVTLTQGFWMAKFETTQGQWKRVMGKLPGPLTAELPEGDDLPVGNVNFAETEAFCRKLTELARQSGKLPKDWEFRLPTEAQWEYACRAGTTPETAKTSRHRS